MQKTSSTQNWVLYVWLAAVYAVLSLYLTNIELFSGVEVSAVLIVILLAISLLVWALYKVFRSLPQSGLISFLVVVLFFSYGHLYNLIVSRMADSALTNHAVCFPAAVAFVVLLVYGALKHPGAAGRMTSVLNFTTIVLVAFPVAKVVDYLYYKTTLEFSAPTPIELNYARPEPLPDIYYIILDGYSREDWLAEWFNFDNSEFIDALEARGFYVADQSCSNYLHTGLSIPSALSMEYLNLPDLGWFGGYREWVFLGYYTAEYNQVAEALKGQGYTYVQIASRFVVTEFDRRADQVIDFRRSGPYITTEPKAQERYLTALLPTTLLKPFFEYLPNLDHRDLPLHFLDPKRILMEFDTIETIPAREEPTFVLVHIMKPHSPYSFDRTGKILKPSGDFNAYEDRDEGYTEQVRFINMRLLDVIDTLLADSAVRPIIIIQGDHGWRPGDKDWSAWRAPILNAYLVPDDVRAHLYPTISPVNSFRVLFDSYFGAHLGLLDDVSYESPIGDMFDIHPIQGEFVGQTWCP